MEETRTSRWAATARAVDVALGAIALGEGGLGGVATVFEGERGLVRLLPEATATAPST